MNCVNRSFFLQRLNLARLSYIHQLMSSVYYYQLYMNDCKFIREEMNAFKRKMNELDYTTRLRLPWSNKGIRHTSNEKEKIATS